MPWVMAAMTAAQMLQGQQNADQQRKANAAAIRYSPWTGISKINTVPNDSVDKAIQGYTGFQGQQSAGQRAGLQDRLMEAQIQRLNKGNTTPGGSMMNDYQDMPRGYENPMAQQNPWGALMMGQRKAY